MTTKNLCLASVFTAIVCLVTRFIQIPIPLGYFNIGNCIILLFCYVMPCPYGLFIGGVGSAVADLLSMPVWAFPTLVIKILMPLAFYGLIKLFNKFSLKYIFAAIISMLIPFAGYTFVGAIIAGSLYAGFTQIPGLALEYAANIVLFALLWFAAKKAGLRRIYESDRSQQAK